jgi:hypothetical protein
MAREKKDKDNSYGLFRSTFGRNQIFNNQPFSVCTKQVVALNAALARWIYASFSPVNMTSRLVANNCRSVVRIKEQG